MGIDTLIKKREKNRAKGRSDDEGHDSWTTISDGREEKTDLLYTAAAIRLRKLINPL